MSSVCSRVMRYNFTSLYTVHCICFVQILLMTKFHDVTKHSYHVRKIKLHSILDGSRYSESLKVGRFGDRIPVGSRDFFCPHLSSPALRFTQPRVQWVPGLFPPDKVARVWWWPHTPVTLLPFCAIMTSYRKQCTFYLYLDTRGFITQIQAPAALFHYK
jgi:hypothetical protein